MTSQEVWRRKCGKDLVLEELLPYINKLDWRDLYFNVGSSPLKI